MVPSYRHKDSDTSECKTSTRRKDYTFIETVRIQSLSNNSYVVGSEQSGQCAVIDPARDIDQYTNIASNHGVRIVYALETHLHNDFISGARDLAAQT